MTHIFPSRFRFRFGAYNPGQQQRTAARPIRSRRMERAYLSYKTLPTVSAWFCNSLN